MSRRLMLLVAVAWRNLWRNKRRTVLSLLSIALVAGLLVFMLSFQLSVYAAMKEKALRIFDGYAEFQPAGYAADPALDRTIMHPVRLARDAADIDGVTAAAPRIDAFAILANGQRSYGAAIIGVDPERETKISSIAAITRDGRYLVPGDKNAAVLGDKLARNLRLSVGGKVTLLGEARDGSVAADVLRIVGIYRSGIPELDRSILEMPLSRAQDIFAMTGRANTIALGGSSLSAINDAMPALKALGRRYGVSIVGWSTLEPAMRDAIALDIAIGAIFYFTLVAVVAFIILNTLLMSVLERRREFGVLLAIGMRPRLIGLMVWIELLCLALFGCAIGLAIGTGVTLWFEHHGIVFSGAGKMFEEFGLPPRFYPTLTPFSALIGPGAIFLSIALGGIVSYARVAGLSAATAVRSQ